MDLGRAIQNERKDQARIDFHCRQQQLIVRCPTSLKGERTYSRLVDWWIYMYLDSLLAEILISAHSNRLQVQQLYQLGGLKWKLISPCIAQLTSVDDRNRVVWHGYDKIWTATNFCLGYLKCALHELHDTLQRVFPNPVTYYIHWLFGSH